MCSDPAVCKDANRELFSCFSLSFCTRRLDVRGPLSDQAWCLCSDKVLVHWCEQIEMNRSQTPGAPYLFYLVSGAAACGVGAADYRLYGPLHALPPRSPLLPATPLPATPLPARTLPPPRTRVRSVPRIRMAISPLNCRCHSCCRKISSSYQACVPTF